jgi:hypothetical protein
MKGSHLLATPLDGARRRLADRMADSRLVLIPGLRDDLKAIDAALGDLDTRTRQLATAVMLKHFGYTVIPDPLCSSLMEICDRNFLNHHGNETS